MDHIEQVCPIEESLSRYGTYDVKTEQFIDSLDLMWYQKYYLKMLMGQKTGELYCVINRNGISVLGVLDHIRTLNIR